MREDTRGKEESTLGDKGPRSWNYRVLNRTRYLGVPGADPIEEWVLIEAYYSADGSLVAWSDEVGHIGSDVSLLDLRGEMELRLEAVDRALKGLVGLLTEDDLPGRGNDGD
jgi:hypothetical protein